jgi:hypothetical protein
MKKLERKVFGEVCCWYRVFIFFIVSILIAAIAVFPFCICMFFIEKKNKIN